jgi:uncharacterized repeat protein (TIGR03803 family)
VLILSLGALTLAHAQTFTVLYAFGSTPTDGVLPWAQLTLNEQGNLYGTTRLSKDGGGIVFKIDSTGDKHTLFDFAGQDTQLLGPLVRVGGTLYGTTYGGQDKTCTTHGGCGAIYSLARGHLTVLHDFTALEAHRPQGLTRDSLGNLYGATAHSGSVFSSPQCGSQGCGSVFEYSQGEEILLYNFVGQPDGRTPNGELLVDRSGNIYGTTQVGGTLNHGMVFELSPNGDGTWTEMILYNFRGTSDGAQPSSGVIMDAKGNLYGVTQEGGLPIKCRYDTKLGCGVVYKLLRNADGSWTERTLHRFGGTSTDGFFPVGNLIHDKQGNLYGVTSDGGEGGAGTVFELQPDGTEILLKSFSTTNNDGGYPAAGLTMDALGNLYGTTTSFGNTACGYYEGCGTVFKITP